MLLKLNVCSNWMVRAVNVSEKRALAELVDVACFSRDTSPHVAAY